ncbi:unnamed protein product [Withania somnifera]
MKREGRQHGLVPTYPTTNSRCVNKLTSPPTAGLFTKASPKPWNHSKFTGKCGRSKCTICHLQLAGKAKGTKKLRDCDIVSNSRLITRRVARLTFSGFSATNILDHLAADHMDLHDDGYCHDANLIYS